MTAPFALVRQEKHQSGNDLTGARASEGLLTI